MKKGNDFHCYAFSARAKPFMKRYYNEPQRETFSAVIQNLTMVEVQFYEPPFSYSARSALR